jgi:hypothetical protein
LYLKAAGLSSTHSLFELNCLCSCSLENCHLVCQPSLILFTQIVYKNVAVTNLKYFLVNLLSSYNAVYDGMIFQKCFGFSISNEAILLDDLVVLLVF